MTTSASTVDMDMVVNKTVLWSGGASGADSEWAHQGHKAGHWVQLSSFPLHKVHGYYDQVKNMKVYPELSAQFSATAEALERPKTNSNSYVIKLLYRDVYLAHQVDTLYAIGHLTKTMDLDGWKKDQGFYGQTDGGTAWSCQAFILKYVDQKIEGPIPLYFFDQNPQQWMQPHISFASSSLSNKRVEWIVMKTSPPKPTGNYGGVGSRKLTQGGRQAIQSVFM
jgi:hypothetical protein